MWAGITSIHPGSAKPIYHAADRHGYHRMGYRTVQNIARNNQSSCRPQPEVQQPLLHNLSLRIRPLLQVLMAKRIRGHGQSWRLWTVSSTLLPFDRWWPVL